jgi:hypothetical protein
MKTVKLSEATAAEMRRYAETTLGLPPIHPNAKDDTIRAKIAPLIDGDEITVEDEPVEAEPMVLVNEESSAGDEMQTILIEKEKGPGGSDSVFVSVNGRAMLIPRGEKVRVPARYVHALENAKQLDYPALEDGGLGEPVEISTYPWRRVA